MFQLKQRQTISTVVRGWLVKPIPYEVRVPTGNWSQYFGHYQNQKWGAWDSNSCWCLSVVNCIEDQLEWLWKNNMFSKEAKDFFTSNGYIDIDGDFSLSERFLEVLGGNLDTGGTTEQACQLIQKYGCIPRDVFSYSVEQANKYFTKSMFNADYFDKNKIVNEMHILGQKFLTYVNIAYQRIGTRWTTPQDIVLLAALKQAPLAISIPIPRNVNNWNVQNPVQWDGRMATDHAVQLYNLGGKFERQIFDQYLPNLKTLSSDYPMYSVIQPIVTAIQPASISTVQQPDNYWIQFWQGLFHYFNGIYDSLVPLGRVKTQPASSSSITVMAG